MIAFLLHTLNKLATLIENANLHLLRRMTWFTFQPKIFPKGLAQKLIPKFIRPYKVLRDFKNQSFQIDLPSHLKQRGVHNVFHAALIRIHVLNDD